jgi:hypothetical protein
LIGRKKHLIYREIGSYVNLRGSGAWWQSAAQELPASIHYGTAERSDMKKESGNAAFKPGKTSSAELVNELYQSQLLQERPNTTVAELKETIALLEQNLEKSHRSAHRVRKTKKRIV